MLKPNVPINYKSMGLAGAGATEFNSLLDNNVGLYSPNGLIVQHAKGTPVVSPGAEEFIFLPIIIVDNNFILKSNLFSSTTQTTWILDDSFNDLDILGGYGANSYFLDPGIYYLVQKVEADAGLAYPTPLVICIDTATLPSSKVRNVAPPWGANYWGINSPTMTALSPLVSGGKFYCSTSNSFPIKGSREITLNQVGDSHDPLNILTVIDITVGTG